MLGCWCGAPWPRETRARLAVLGGVIGSSNLHEEDDGYFMLEDEVGDPLEKAKWFAIAHVHTTREFSPSALYADMKSRHGTPLKKWPREGLKTIFLPFSLDAWEIGIK